jgi:hypothetical protein
MASPRLKIFHSPLANHFSKTPAHVPLVFLRLSLPEDKWNLPGPEKTLEAACRCW